MTTIPFVDLGPQHRALRDELLAAAARVIDGCQFVLGAEVAGFEAEFSAFCGAPHAVGVNSGTSALHLALLAAGVGAGDEVITAPLTFTATAAAIRYTGARPVFADVDPRRYTLDPAAAAAAITPRTRAIVAVHLYGQPADMDPLLALARRHRLLLVEDACQAHGAEYRGRRVGSLADVAAFSFYPAKNLGACGEGGALVTGDEALARKARMLRDWGQEQRYHHVLLGYNYRMDGIQGAFLRVKLRHLPAWIEARRARAALYRELLAGAAVTLPAEFAGSRHVYHLFAALHPRRDELQQRLASRGIGTGLHYPVPLHLQPCFADLGHRPGEFPTAERIAVEELSLPMYAELGEPQVRAVAAALEEVGGVTS